VIRRAIEDAPPIEVQLPDAVFALSFVATVECEHYLAAAPAKRTYRKRTPA
jgi:hypothetical protein